MSLPTCATLLVLLTAQEGAGSAPQELEPATALDRIGEAIGAVQEAEDEGDVPVARAESDPPWTWAEIEAELVLLQESFPDRVRRDSLGKSQAGRAIPVLVLGDDRSRSDLEKPGLLFFDASPPDQGGAEATLEFARRLLELSAEEPLATILRETVVYVAPALDPDVRSPRAVEGDVADFRLNFPVGWLPESLRPGSGPFPLARPETRAAVDFLHAHPNLVIALGVLESPGIGSRELLPGGELPAGDREVFTALRRSDPVRLIGWDRMRTQGGGILDYAYQAAGIFSLALILPESGPGSSSDRWRAEGAQVALGLLTELPRLSISEAMLTNLGPRLWTLDVKLANLGTIPTRSELGELRAQRPGLRFELTGGKVLWTARKDSADGLFARAEEAQSIGAVGQERLLGKQARWMRFVFEADPGGQIELEGGSSWTGTTRLALALK